MQGDILPKGQPKTKTPNKNGGPPLHKSAAKKIEPPKLKSSVKPKAAAKEAEKAVDLHAVKPLAMAPDPVLERSKRVSLARIKANIHPRHWYNLNREEQLVLLGGLSIIFITLITTVVVLGRSPRPAKLAPVVVKAAPRAPTVEAPLTGERVAPELAKRPITGIMIENSQDARPQSGLQDAGVVYEAIAEGGITRFIALFQDKRPQYIGPVRSLRPYYIDFATPWDASIAHVGGSPEALDQIRSGGKDLDQFFNADSYWRQPTRDAPHNVYTSFDRLDSLNQIKGYTASNFTPWHHKKDAPLASPSAKSIDLSISSNDFNVHYDYDKASNSYLRSEGGKPHISTVNADNGSGSQLKPKTIIVPIVSYNLESDGKHSEYGLDGSGNLYIFQDGGVVQGTWSKNGRSDQFHFKDSAGNEIKLNAGQAWVTLLSGDNQLVYSP